MQAASTPTIEYQFKQTQVQSGQDVLIPVDISGASEILIRMRNNTAGTVLDRDLDSGVIFLTDGMDGIVRYKFTTAEATAGEWDCQGFVKWNDVSEFWGNIRTFTIKANLPSS